MNFDMNIIMFIHQTMQHPILDMIMPWITRLGDGGKIWIVISLLLISMKKYRKAGMMTLCAILLGYILGDVILKNLIQRPRPFVAAPYLNVLIEKPSSFSFPSGHTAVAFAAASMMMKIIRNKGITIFVLLLACTMAFSRLYLQVHYPSDILGGMILGMISASITYRIFNRGEGYGKKEQGIDA
ncbi:MAG: phosphatase PAP2 family protein [Bacillota bacterium]